jgi:hypothetical protein
MAGETMMTRLTIRTAALLGTALLLLACGGKDEGEKVTVSDGEGGSATVRYGGDENGISAPENLPAFAPVYPGAMIQSAVTGDASEAKGMVTFLTEAKQAEVLAFYKEKAAAAGLKVKAEVAMGPGRMLALTREGGANEAMQITTTPGEDGKLMVAVVYDGGKAQ